MMHCFQPHLIVSALLLALSATQASAADPTVILVVGAGGTAEFAEQFLDWSSAWKKAAEASKATLHQIGVAEPPDGNDRERLVELLRSEASGSSPVWLIFIGHGTFDGKIAKFNLRGPDISATELATVLTDFERPLAVVNCASASAPFINALSGPNRVVITATKSGAQYNFARFGRFMAQAMLDPSADIDKDEQTSLLEAFLLASAKVVEFYELDSRLATEHALLDDNGDGLGTLSEWYRGVRATRVAKDGASFDGLRANQMFLVRSAAEQQLSDEARLERDSLEAKLESLRSQKDQLSESEYFARLEVILLALAKIYVEQPGAP